MIPINEKIKAGILRIAAFQGLGPAKSLDTQLQTVKKVLKEADLHGIDIVCFPEGFLTGYYSEREQAEKHSLSLSSTLFSDILYEISCFHASAVLGFNEKSGDHLFNSAAIIDRGNVLGIQRKHFLYHNYFTQGSEFDPIPVKGTKAGILICLDSNYLEPARILALKGAKILFVPMCNQVPLGHPFTQTPEYYSHFIARSYENNCWLFAADWQIPKDGHTICIGHSCIYDPDGKEISRSHEAEQLLTAEIPLARISHTNSCEGVQDVSSALSSPQPKPRVGGSKVLNSQLSVLLAAKECFSQEGTGEGVLSLSKK